MYIKRLRKNVYALVLHHYSTVASKTAPSRKMLRFPSSLSTWKSAEWKKKEERKKFIDRGYGLGCNYVRGFRYSFFPCLPPWSIFPPSLFRPLAPLKNHFPNQIYFHKFCLPGSMYWILIKLFVQEKGPIVRRETKHFVRMTSFHIS